MDKDVNRNYPLVSINMPVYNGTEFIKQAIDSVLCQTYSNWELIIVNDCSTDNSLEVINTYSDPRIKVFANEINKGIGFSRNKAAGLSSGKYIAILDCDDIMLPNRIQEQVAFLEANPEYKMTGSWVELIDPNGKKTNEEWQYTLDDKFISTELFFNNYFTQSAIMLHQSVVKEYSYNEELAPAEDYMLWCQIAQKHKVHNIQKTLTQYRVHSGSISHTAKNVQDSAVNEIIKHNLKRLKFRELDPAEITLHIAVLTGNKAYISSNNLSEKALWWVYKLKRQNELQQVFVSSHFNLKLKRIWNEYFDIETSYKWGIKSIIYLFLGVNQQYNLKMKIRFIYRAIISSLNAYDK